MVHHDLRGVDHLPQLLNDFLEARACDAEPRVVDALRLVGPQTSQLTEQRGLAVRQAFRDLSTQILQRCPVRVVHSRVGVCVDQHRGVLIALAAQLTHGRGDPEPQCGPAQRIGDRRLELRRRRRLLRPQVVQLDRRDRPDHVEAAGDLLRVLSIDGMPTEQRLGPLVGLATLQAQDEVARIEVLMVARIGQQIREGSGRIAHVADLGKARDHVPDQRVDLARRQGRLVRFVADDQGRTVAQLLLGLLEPIAQLAQDDRVLLDHQ